MLFFTQPLRNFRQNTLYRIHSIKFFLASTALTIMVKANEAYAMCFQQKDGIAAEVRTRTGISESRLFDIFHETCGAPYRDDDDLCPSPLFRSLQDNDYGHGWVPPSTSCTYTHFEDSFDSCIDQVLTNNCPDGWGTTLDWITTAGMILGGACMLSCLYICYRFSKDNLSRLGTSTPLQTDRTHLLTSVVSDQSATQKSDMTTTTNSTNMKDSVYGAFQSNSSSLTSSHSSSTFSSGSRDSRFHNDESLELARNTL